MYHLVVRSAFGGYSKGALINDASEISRILSDPHSASHVVKIGAFLKPLVTPHAAVRAPGIKGAR